MSLTIYSFHDHPHEFAVTKINAPLEQCVFLLDFTRPLKKWRQLFGRKTRIGITVALIVPIIHQGEKEGGFLIGVDKSDPYFADLLKLWNKHYGTKRSLASSVEPLEIIADFAIHFPENYAQNNEP